jgi:hypothetical protein
MTGDGELAKNTLRGFLSAVLCGEAMRPRLAASSQALAETGYVENLTIE